MRNLLHFFIKHSAWFMFLVYLILSLVLLFHNNPYQQSVYLTSANSVTAATYEALSTVTSYFHLKDINEDLQERNAFLEMEMVTLRAKIKDLQLQLPDSTMPLPTQQHFDFVTARVISNSISQPNNFITINRGSDQGIEAEMGVVDQNGVVGIVNVVGKNASRIISLLNPNMRLSCKLKNSEYFGSMVWDGISPQYAIFEDLPKHMTFEKGDTVVTSGYSAVFPEGLIVGIVEGRARGDKENFEALKVRLTTNFSQLDAVRVITNDMSAQLRELEKKTAADSIAAKRGKKGGQQ